VELVSYQFYKLYGKILLSGLVCEEGVCVDLDECVNGNHNCHSYEVCTNLQNGNGWKCGPSDIECPTEVSAAEWKGVI